MKKMSLLIIALSLSIISCDSTTSGDAVSEAQKAQSATGLKIVTDGMNSLDPAIITGFIDETETPAKAISAGETVLQDKDGMKITSKLVMQGTRLGLQLRFTMTGYKSEIPIYDANGKQTGTDTSIVNGEFIAVMSYDILKSQIVILADTTDGKELVFTGGSMDGVILGFDKLEMAFSTSEINLGSPVSVKGTVTINGFPVVIDSEIIELLMGLMGI